MNDVNTIRATKAIIALRSLFTNPQSEHFQEVLVVLPSLSVCVCPHFLHFLFKVIREEQEQEE